MAVKPLIYWLFCGVPPANKLLFTSGFLTVIMVKPEFKMRRFSPLKTRVKKPKTKGTKADSVEKVTVAELLPSLENTVLNKN